MIEKMQYINRDLLLNKLKNELNRWEDSSKEYKEDRPGVYAMRGVIKDIESMEIENIISSVWERVEDTQEGLVRYICPNCFDYHGFKIGSDNPLLNEHTFHENYLYCRKCGAKMNGK